MVPFSISLHNNKIEKGRERCHVDKNQTSCTVPDKCPQLPGTILRINIPAGAVINLLNLIEITSPSGICLIVRIPLLSGNLLSVNTITDAIKKAGGTIEFIRE